MKTALAQQVTHPAVTFLGAAQSVTGSMHLLGAAGRRILLDCGLVRGRRSEERLRNSRFPFDPTAIDAALTCAGGGQAPRVTSTGALGRRGLPFLRQPSPVPAADLVISESTYGGRTHDTLEAMAAKCSDVVRRTVARGGKVLVPAFSL